MIPVQLNIEYNGGKKENKTYSHPETLNELTGVQLVAIAPLLMAGEISQEQRTILCQILLNVPDAEFVAFTADQINALLDLQEFIFDDKALTSFALDSFIHNGKAYYGPARELVNMCFDEFMFAEASYRKYVDTKEPAYLYNFIACLYREEAEDPTAADRRDPFDSNSVIPRAELFKTLPEPVIAAIVLSFTGCLNMIPEWYPVTFPAEEEEILEPEEKPAPKKKAKQSRWGWAEIKHDIAETGTFGDFEKVGKTRFRDILNHLEIKLSKPDPTKE